MNNFKDHLSIVQTIHPSLVGACLELLEAVDANPSYGQLDQHLAIANFFIQVFNDESDEQYVLKVEK